MCMGVVKGNLRDIPYSRVSPDTAPLVSCGKSSLGSLVLQMEKLRARGEAPAPGCTSQCQAQDCKP